MLVRFLRHDLRVKSRELGLDFLDLLFLQKCVHNSNKSSALFSREVSRSNILILRLSHVRRLSADLLPGGQVTLYQGAKWRKSADNPEALTQTFAITHAAPPERVQSSGVRCMSESSFTEEHLSGSMGIRWPWLNHELVSAVLVAVWSSHIPWAKC